MSAADLHLRITFIFLFVCLFLSVFPTAAMLLWPLKFPLYFLLSLPHLSSDIIMSLSIIRAGLGDSLICLSQEKKDSQIRMVSEKDVARTSPSVRGSKLFCF